MTTGDRLARAERLLPLAGKVAASLTHKNSDTPTGPAGRHRQGGPQGWLPRPLEPLLMAAPRRVIDTSAWIVWLTGSALGKQLPDKQQCSVPTIVQLELSKWRLSTTILNASSLSDITLTAPP